MREAGLTPIVEHNANSTGTGVTGHLTELFGFSAFVLDDGTGPTRPRAAVSSS